MRVSISVSQSRCCACATGSVTTFPLNGLVQVGPFTSPFAFADSATAHLSGVIGGGQIGYNYQFSPNGVLGFEADIQGSGEQGSVQFADAFAGTVVANNGETGPFNGAASTSYQAKIDWFGTVRGRFGFLVGDQLLIYGTGGLAYGKVGVSGNSNLSFVGSTHVFSPTTAGLDGSKTSVGFVVGGGAEGRLLYWMPSNWTWKVEYLYLDLGSLDTSTSFALFPPSGTIFTPATGTITTHTRFTDNVVRVGLNYKFGYAAAPAVYK
jgi:outer membrane immunogenic protein